MFAIKLITSGKVKQLVIWSTLRIQWMYFITTITYTKGQILSGLSQAMLEDKLRETDWEVTQETIEEQVARESYLQWLRDNEKRARTNEPVG